MSVSDRKNQKLVLPRTGVEVMQKAILKKFRNREDALRNLAMLSLRVQGWELKQIGIVFGGLHKGHVSRILKDTIRQVREELDFPTYCETLDVGDEE